MIHFNSINDRELVLRKNNTAGKVIFYEETSAMLAQKKKYARNLLAIRPRDVSLEDASGLSIKSKDLFVWAIESSEKYFEITETAKHKVRKLLKITVIIGCSRIFCIPIHIASNEISDCSHDFYYCLH